MEVPVVPQTNPSTQPLTAPGMPSDANFGEDIGKALGTAGSEIGALSSTIQQQQQTADRFQAMRQFSDFQTNVGKTMLGLQQQAPLGVRNFPDIATATYKNMEADFLNNLAKTAPALQEEFAARTGAFGAQIAANAMKFQLDNQNAYFTNGIDTEYNKSMQILGNDTSLATLANEKARLKSFIDASGLDAASKVQLQRQYFTKMEALTYKGQVLQDQTNEAANPGQGASQGAAEIISTYGGDGAFNSNLTYDENQQQLQSRIIKDTSTIVGQIGSVDLWAALPTRAQSALISVADSEGGQLPTDIVNAIRSGDLTNVTKAVAALGTPRAAAEASIISGQNTPLEGMLDANPLFANLPYEDRLTLRADAQKEALSAVTAHNAAVKAMSKQMVNSLFVALADGKAGQTDIDAMRQQGTLSEYADIAKAEDILNNKQTDVALAARTQSMLAAGAPIDPTDKNDVRGLNALFGKEGVASLLNMDGNYAATTLIPMIRTAQDIPTDAVGTLTGMTRSQDTQKALWAYDLLSQIQQASPKAFDQRFKGDVASNTNFYDVAKDYYDPATLFSLMQGGTDAASRQEITMLRQQAKELLTTAANVKSLHLTNDFLTQMQKSVGGFFGIGGSTPQLPIDPSQKAELTRDFQQLFIDEYPKYQDAAQAAAAATKLVQRVWGVSNVSGTPTLMKYPPEKVGYTPINNSYDWIGQQVRDDLQLPADSTFQLIGDDQTRGEFSKFQSPSPPRRPAEPLTYDDQGNIDAPSYLVAIKDANGVVHLATDDKGQPRRIFFEQTPAMKAAAVAAYVAKNQELVQRRDRLMQTLAHQHMLETGTPIPPPMMQEWIENQAQGGAQ